MTPFELFMIGVGGFLGAIIRYSLSTSFNRPKKIPMGTLIVNLTGALLIGSVFGLELSRMWTFFLASGFAGALTTFSTMNKELIGMWQEGQKKKAVLYVGITYLLGISLTVTGYWITSIN